jgi:hypothetical protein
MGFSKRLHLQQNIDALRIAFKLEKEKRQATVGERLLMMHTADLAVLNSFEPYRKRNRHQSLEKNEHDLFPITQELHQLLKENSEDDKQYRRYVDSMKSSVLTAFYTPPQVIDAISSACGIAVCKLINSSNPPQVSVHSYNLLQKTKDQCYRL